MNVEFIEPATIELDDAVKYYNLESPGLGDEFFDEVLKTIELINVFPKVWSEITKNTRVLKLESLNTP
ncbi:MAG: hypothetical protein R6V04_03590 [bacterium]